MLIVVAVRAEGMIKLFLLILVIVSQTSRCLATGQTATTQMIRRDIIESICGFSFRELIMAYQRYCENDGFEFCSEYMHTPHLVKAVVAYAVPLYAASLRSERPSSN